MAVSITQAQTSFLNRGGLDNLGTAFTPTESISALAKLAGMLIEAAQNNLIASNQISSGALSGSFIAQEPKEVNGIITVEISALEYFDFQNKGVRGVGGGSSGANYSFKNAFPSQKMVDAIEAWITRGGISTANVPARHAIAGHESKQKAISAQSVAYATARAIKIHGIKGTGYFDKAIQVAKTYAQDVLGKALAVDIIHALPTNISGPSLRRSA